ncbi:MAG: hypothetical protein KKE82_09235, partial [Proteobacteria bacterium]|nr:hypothetical protein [Pseudomonadota bacterium]
ARQVAGCLFFFVLFLWASKEKEQKNEASSSNCRLISANLPQHIKNVIPEAILIGNPVFNRPNSWIPDKDIRG